MKLEKQHGQRADAKVRKCHTCSWDPEQSSLARTEGSCKIPVRFHPNNEMVYGEGLDYTAQFTFKASCAPLPDEIFKNTECERRVLWSVSAMHWDKSQVWGKERLLCDMSLSFQSKFEDESKVFEQGQHNAMFQGNSSV